MEESVRRITARVKVLADGSESCCDVETVALTQRRRAEDAQVFTERDGQD